MRAALHDVALPRQQGGAGRAGGTCRRASNIGPSLHHSGLKFWEAAEAGAARGLKEISSSHFSTVRVHSQRLRTERIMSRLVCRGMVRSNGVGACRRATSTNLETNLQAFVCGVLAHPDEEEAR
jgi:hypothetical protein